MHRYLSPSNLVRATDRALSEMGLFTGQGTNSMQHRAITQQTDSNPGEVGLNLPNFSSEVEQSAPDSAIPLAVGGGRHAVKSRRVSFFIEREQIGTVVTAIETEVLPFYSSRPHFLGFLALEAELDSVQKWW